ncbi:MAG: prevent-host-death protein, partial [Candidatus Marinimicrobia bacterium]|nr:prevent-host-death protein [Candidatus Neomarinimicrobiota bacterium]
AVLISEQEYDSLNETLALLSTPGFREDFEQSRLQEQKGETLSYEEVFGEKQ